MTGQKATKANTAAPRYVMIIGPYSLLVLCFEIESHAHIYTVETQRGNMYRMFDMKTMEVKRKPNLNQTRVASYRKVKTVNFKTQRDN